MLYKRANKNLQNHLEIYSKYEIKMDVIIMIYNYMISKTSVESVLFGKFATSLPQFQYEVIAKSSR